MTQFITPLCTALPHPGNTAIYSINSIIDLSGVSLSTMWSLRHHLQQASELATHQYPESMNITAVVNAPAYFATVWSWISVRQSSGISLQTLFCSEAHMLFPVQAWFDEGESKPYSALVSYGLSDHLLPFRYTQQNTCTRQRPRSRSSHVNRH